MSNEIVPIKKNLSANEIAVIESLPELYKGYLALRQERPIKNLNPMELKSYCLKIITMANVDGSPNGQIDSRVLQFQTGQLVEELKGRFKELTISELQTAFKRGIRGDAGQYFGMCAKTYHQFIKWFYELPERQEAWVKYLEKIDAENKIKGLSEEKKRSNSKNSLRQLFKDYRDTGDLGMCPWAYYSVLCDFIGFEVEFSPGKTYKTLIQNEKIRKELETQADEIYADNKNIDGLTDSIYNRKSVGLSVMKYIIIGNLDKKEALIRLKKEIALRFFFDQLIKENKELEL